MTEAEQADRDVSTIADDLERTRAELVDTIERIVDRVSPKRVVSRWTTAVNAQVEAVKKGELTPVAVTAAAAAATAVAVTALVLLRRRRR